MYSPRAEILTRMLDAHERSVSYGRSAPWPRDVIVELNAKGFPDAFAPDGRERWTALVAATTALEKERTIRLVRHARGPLTGEPKEARLGPLEIDRAYEAAQLLGYEPLAVGLREIERHATTLATRPSANWMQPFLEAVARTLQEADPASIGMSRERFKRDWRDLLPALTAATGLAGGITPAWERVVSERLLQDSKLLARVRSLVVALLVRADPRWKGVPPDEAADLLEAYGVRRKPGLIPCAGSATLLVGESRCRMEDFNPVAHLPDEWAEAWVTALIDAKVRLVTTIENQYPFLAYVEESGGPSGLGDRGEVAVYTGGFPTPALVTALANLASRAPEVSFRHWGDADVGGLRIWSFLRARLLRPLEHFRTTSDWIRTEACRGGRSLSASERQSLERMRDELDGVEGRDVAVAQDVIGALLSTGIKIEQERF